MLSETAVLLSCTRVLLYLAQAWIRGCTGIQYAIFRSQSGTGYYVYVYVCGGYYTRTYCTYTRYLPSRAVVGLARWRASTTRHLVLPCLVSPDPSRLGKACSEFKFRKFALVRVTPVASVSKYTLALARAAQSHRHRQLLSVQLSLSVDVIPKSFLLMHDLRRPTGCTVSNPDLRLRQ